jgi:hypothetical protein
MQANSASLELGILDGAGRAFDDILALRLLAYGRTEAGTPEPIDLRSYHVTARTRNSQLVATMRVTCRRDGPLESEAAYPAWILDGYARQLSACSRLCRHPDLAGASQLTLALMETAWREGLRRGVRVDVSKVRRRAIPYYVRMGSYFVKGSLFAFDKWQVECGLVAMGTASTRLTPFSSVFADVVDAIDIYSRHPDKLTTDVSDVRRAKADVLF